MSEQSYEGGRDSTPKKPHDKGEKPEAIPPEARRHDSGGDASQHDAAPEKSASSRQFRDSQTGTLDKATTFKGLDRSTSGRPLADSAPQGTGKSFFSALRNPLLGDRSQAPLAFTRFGASPSRDNPDTKTEQPERKPPETRRHSSGGDTGLHDTAPEKSASSRQFRDSLAGTLDKVTALKGLDQSTSDQSLAGSGSQRDDSSFFSQLRDHLQGDRSQAPLAFMRFGIDRDMSGGYRSVEPGPAAEKKPYTNPFQREPRPEPHDVPQTQQDQPKNTVENKAHADTAQSEQNEQGKEQLADNTAIRYTQGIQSLQGPNETTTGDATDKSGAVDSGHTDKVRPDNPDGGPSNYVRDLLLAHYETARSSGLEHDRSFTPHIIGRASLGAIIAPALDARAWENVTPFSSPAPSVIVESYRLRRGEENRVDFYSNGDVSHVTLTDADFEKALLWGQPNQSQLNGFEKDLTAGTIEIGRGYSDVKLLIDPEGGTVGYKVFWGQGGTSAGYTIFSRHGEGLGGSIGPGLEPPDFWPTLVLSLASDAARGLVTAGAKMLIRDVGDQLGNALAKGEAKRAPTVAMGEIKSTNSYTEALRQLSSRPHPFDGRTALVMYDEAAQVSMQVFAQQADGVRRIVWEGVIGQLAPPSGLKFGTSGYGNWIEDEVISLVNRATGQQFPQKAANAGGPDLLLAPFK